MDTMAMIDMMFIEICKALGYTVWEETETMWSEIAEIITKSGISEKKVAEFFENLKWHKFYKKNGLI